MLIFCLLRSHGLEANVPAREVTLLDSVIHVLLRIIGRVVGRIFLSDKCGSLLALHVHLSVDPLALLVDELDGVAVVAVHLAPPVGNASVAHENHDLVN
jgi:hypothetical protein